MGLGWSTYRNSSMYRGWLTYIWRMINIWWVVSIIWCGWSIEVGQHNIEEVMMKDDQYLETWLTSDGGEEGGVNWGGFLLCRGEECRFNCGESRPTFSSACRPNLLWNWMLRTDFLHKEDSLSLVLVYNYAHLRHKTLLNRVITAQCEGMGEVGSARYEPALLPPCPSIRALCYSNCQRSTQSHQQSKG